MPSGDQAGSLVLIISYQINLLIEVLLVGFIR